MTTAWRCLTCGHLKFECDCTATMIIYELTSVYADPPVRTVGFSDWPGFWASGYFDYWFFWEERLAFSDDGARMIER